MMCDFGTGNNNKLNWVLEDKQEMIDIIETIYRGAKKGRGLVISPKGECGFFFLFPFSFWVWFLAWGEVRKDSEENYANLCLCRLFDQIPILEVWWRPGWKYGVLNFF